MGTDAIYFLFVEWKIFNRMSDNGGDHVSDDQLNHQVFSQSVGIANFQET